MCSATERRDAGEALNLRRVLELLERVTRGSGLRKHGEPGAGVAEGPRRRLDLLGAQRRLHPGDVVAARRERLRRSGHTRSSSGQNLRLENGAEATVQRAPTVGRGIGLVDASRPWSYARPPASRRVSPRRRTRAAGRARSRAQPPRPARRGRRAARRSRSAGTGRRSASRRRSRARSRSSGRSPTRSRRARAGTCRRGSRRSRGAARARSSGTAWPDARAGRANPGRHVARGQQLRQVGVEEHAARGRRRQARARSA